ncbi:MAG: hypothetical protein P0116_08325 [Candidatus Nitrosocosmicus sp.]|nr:hypothetical protein [Candidatus Nitrosocosmicus sp.]
MSNISVFIKKYCEGKTLDQIAEETSLSKGTVYNLVKHWKDCLGNAGIEEIREFGIIVNKSGMTIQECALGFRMVQILKTFGINDEFEERTTSRPKRDLLEEIRKESTGWDRGNNDYLLSSQEIRFAKKRNMDKTEKNEIYFFIEEMYNKCKKNSIKPSDSIEWIKDLHDFFDSLGSDSPYAVSKDPYLSLSSENEDESNTLNYLNRAIEGEIGGDNLKNFENIEDLSTKQINESEISIEIPFISQVTYHLDQIKQELKGQERLRNSLKTDISFLENKKSALENNLRETTNKNNNVLTQLQWYGFLKQDLFDNYNINLDDEILFFSSNTIDLNTPKLQNLLKQIASRESQLDISRQTIKIYWDLDDMGFNLKKLKQLYNTIIEIAVSNEIPVLDAVKKFLDDIEEQYDSKLGFETKIKELNAKKSELENEIPKYKENLLIQSQMTPLLLYLKNNGVTNEDIINMSQLVVLLQDGDFLSNTLSQGGNTLAGVRNKNSEKNSKNETWKLLIKKLRSVQNLDSEIEKLTIQLLELESRTNLDQIR